ncbi:MAG: asparaginase [Clostridia bacterium]|nr:asparaginase [Clostridia bacterium]
MRKKICIIYTGGTIGMVPGENGYVPSKSRLEDSLDEIGDLFKPGMPALEVIQFDPLLDSSNVSIPEWNKIGKTIADNYEKYDGFVVLHGTDTMSYSASALSFMLENLEKPVIFTGAQIPLCEIRSDGYSNIVSSVVIAAEGRVKEVCIYFDGKLIRGCRSTKISSDRFAAFASPNFGLLADVGITVEYHDRGGLPPKNGAFKFTAFEEVPVGIIKMFPGIQIRLFESIMTKQLKGVVLETFGAGNIPSGSAGEIIPIIKKAYENGILIVVCSQCIQGTVTLGTYETSKSLKDIGAVTGNDMTTEAALTKLIYLFSCHYPIDQIRERMAVNLRGEMG